MGVFEEENVCQLLKTFLLWKLRPLFEIQNKERDQEDRLISQGGQSPREVDKCRKDMANSFFYELQLQRKNYNWLLGLDSFNMVTKKLQECR